MGIILAVILGLTFVALVVLGIRKACEEYDDGKKTNVPGRFFVSALIVLIVLILIPFSLHTVNTGEVAVVKVFGEAQSVRAAGLHFDFWMTKQYERYDTKIQKMEITTASYSSDAQTMDIEMTVQYQIDADKVLEITKNFGSLELLQSKIESIVIEQTKAVLSAHKAMDIIANRAAMSPMVEDAIRKAIGDKYYVAINTVVLTDIAFSDVFETAVENKMVAEQQLLKAEYENKQKIEKAEANAKVKELNATAEKKANELLQKSLTPEILKEEWIQKWDGKLPNTLAGEDAGIMVVPGE